MNKWVNIIGQTLGFFSQVIAPAFIHNPKSVAIAAVAIASGQAALGIAAHFYNPDGAKATYAYDPATGQSVIQPSTGPDPVAQAGQ
jgi:hypothetical protein